jgi:hypothetical protein
MRAAGLLLASLAVVRGDGDGTFTILPNGDGTCSEDLGLVADWCKEVVTYPYFTYSVHDADRLRAGAEAYQQGTSAIPGECVPSAVQLACVW